MRGSLIILCFIFISLAANAVPRFIPPEAEHGRKLICIQKKDIFKDYLFTFPDIKSREIPLGIADYNFTFHGIRYSMRLNNDSCISIRSNANLVASDTEKTSAHDIYYNKDSLKFKNTYIQRWVTYVHSDGLTKEGARWRPFKDDLPDIPAYKYFSFILSDSTHILVYHVDHKYYLQNISYLYASDNDGAEFILTDNNANGNYNDSNDEITFNPWNPYNEKSIFKAPPFMVVNKWNTMEELQKEYLLDIDISGDTLFFNCINSFYKHDVKMAKVQFVNIPNGAIFTINGHPYMHFKSGFTYGFEYGIYRATVQTTDYLQWDTLFIVDEKHPVPVIRYPKMPESSQVILKNVLFLNYYVEVSNEKGYRKVFHNPYKINIPEGECKIALYSNFLNLEKRMTTLSGSYVEIDYDLELKKRVPEK